MPDKEQFLQAVKNGYTFKGEAIKIGRAVLDGEVIEGADVYLPLSTLNRGSIAANHCRSFGTKPTQPKKRKSMESAPFFTIGRKDKYRYLR